jgi:hypothetical protein
MSSGRSRDRNIKIARDRERSPMRENDKKERILCRFGKDCFRKNPEHLKEFFHPHTFLNEIVEFLKPPNDKFSIGEKVIDPEFEIINDNNDEKLKEFIVYCIINFEKIVKMYNIQDLIFIFMQFDARNSSRTFKVCDNETKKNIESIMKDNSFYKDINSDERKEYDINKNNCMRVNSSYVLVLLQDYQNKQQEQTAGKRESYKRESYKSASKKRKTHKRKTNKRKTNKNNKKILSIKTRKNHRH